MKILIQLLMLLFFYSTITFAEKSPLLITSNNASNWSKQNTPAYFNNITHDDAILIATAQENNTGVIFKSVDQGVNWSRLNLPNSKDIPSAFNALATFNHRWIALGSNATILFSDTQGETWQFGALPPDVKTANPQLRALSGDSENSVIVGQYTMAGVPSPLLLVSHDQGATWSSFSNALPADIRNKGSLDIIKWDGTTWMASGQKDGHAFIIVSSDLINWQLSPLSYPYSSVKKVLSIASDGKVWLTVVSVDGRYSIQLFKSVDEGKTWIKATDNFERKDFGYVYVSGINAIQWNGKEWLIVGSGYVGQYFNPLDDQTDPLILSSADGEHWEKTNLPLDVLAHADFRPSALIDVIWNGSAWIAIGTYDQLKPGCETFAGNWAGDLQRPSESISATMGLGLMTKNPKDNTQYSFNSGAFYYSQSDASWGVGVGGVCVEKDDTATLTLSNNNGSPLIVTLKKALAGDSLEVTATHAKTRAGENTFVGTMVRAYYKPS